jgi:MATE family multidrug resistance protein
MVVGITANLLNVALDYILIFGKFGLPAMGIAGAATATVIAVAFQAGVLHSLFLSRPVHRTYASRHAYALDLTKCKDLFRIGWPAGVSSFLDVFGWAIFTGFIVGSFGTIALGAHTAAINYMHFSFMPAMALSAAATAVVGQWIGRGDIDTAKARAYTAVKVGMAFMLCAALCFAIFGGTLMRVFSEDPEVIQLGRFLLILAAIFACFDAVSIVLIGALRGAGDTRWIMWALTAGAYLVNLPLAWLFAVPLELGAGGAWIGATIYVISLSGVVLWRFRSEKWRNIRIFTEESPEEIPLPNAETANAK